MPRLNPDGDASGLALRSAIRCSLLLMALALVPILPAFALSARAYDDTLFGCIVGREPDKPGTNPTIVIMKLSDRSTVRLDMSRFKFQDGNSLKNDECYRVRAVREGGVLFTPYAMPAYTLINGRVGYRWIKDRFETGLAVYNLLGDDHREHPFGNAIGRRVLVTATGSF